MELTVKKVVESAISFNNAKTLSRPKLKKRKRGWGEKKGNWEGGIFLLTLGTMVCWCQGLQL